MSDVDGVRRICDERPSELPDPCDPIERAARAVERAAVRWERAARDLERTLSRIDRATQLKVSAR